MKIIVVGAGEHGTQTFYVLKRLKEYEVVGFVDDDPCKHGTAHCGLTVLGGTGVLAELRKQGVEGAIVAIGDNYRRREHTERLWGVGFQIINAIHPTTMIDESAVFGRGVIVEMGVAVHPLARIGDCVFLGGSSVISHHSVVEDNVLIGGGVIFGGNVHVGRNTLIGVGAVLQPHIRIGADVVVGIGAAVVDDLPDNVVAVGVPAKIIRQHIAAR
jgi:sugar O-acyltransferase (sialic acid O-acetyltransferase NeuD family)